MNENDIGVIIVDTAYNLHSKLGFILNFGSEIMKTGIHRIINGKTE